MGFGIWTAHYWFHLLTGPLTIVPAATFFCDDSRLAVARSNELALCGTLGARFGYDPGGADTPDRGRLGWGIRRGLVRGAARTWP